MSSQEAIQSIVDYLSWYSDYDLLTYIERQGLQSPVVQPGDNLSRSLRNFVARYLHELGWFIDDQGYLSQYNTSVARFTKLPNSTLRLSGEIIYPELQDLPVSYTKPILDPRDLSNISTLSPKEVVDLFEIAIREVKNSTLDYQILFDIVPWLRLEERELDRVYSYLTQGNLAAALREVRDLQSDSLYE
jgi:hypothetical protein